MIRLDQKLIKAIVLLMLSATMLSHAAFADWKWSKPFVLTETHGGSLSTDMSDRLIINWVDKQIDNFWIMTYQVYDKAGSNEFHTISLGAAEVINSPDSFKLISNNKGNYVAVWPYVVDEKGTSSLRVSMTDMNMYGWHVWPTPIDLDPPSKVRQGFEVEANIDGSVSIGWTKTYGTDERVIEDTIFKDNQWRPITSLKLEPNEKYRYSVRDAFGNRSTYWVDEEAGGGRKPLKYAYYASGYWSRPKEIIENIPDYYGLFGISLNPAGDGTIIWGVRRKEDNYRTVIQAARISKDKVGNIQDLSNTADSVSRSIVKTDIDGKSMVVWRAGSDIWRIFGRLVTNSDWGKLEQINRRNDRLQLGDLSVGLDGSFVAVWETYSYDWLTNLIQSSRWGGNAWSSVKTLGSFSGNGTQSPKVVVDASGNATASWGIGGLTGARETSGITKNRLILASDQHGSISSSIGDIRCDASCAVDIQVTSPITLKAQGKPGYEFKGWGGTSDCIGVGDCSFKVEGTKSVTATFEPSHTQSVRVINSALGVVSSDPPRIICGNKISECTSEFYEATFTATPNSGYYLKKWLGCPTPIGNTCSLTLTKKTTIGAVYAKLPKYPLKITKSQYGEITSDPAGLKCSTNSKICVGKFSKGGGGSS